MIDEIRGEVLCGSCGIVISDLALEQPRFYETDPGNPNKISWNHEPTRNNYSGKGLGSEISHFPRRGQSGTATYTFHQLRKINRRVKMGQDYYVNKGLKRIRDFSSILQLPHVISASASLIYRNAWNKGMTKGRSVDQVAAASIFIACRQFDKVVTYKEVIGTTGVDKKHLFKLCRILKTNLNLVVKPPNSFTYLEKICSELQVKDQVKELSRRILMKCQEKGIQSGRSPMVELSGAVYLSGIITGDRKTQKEIMQACQTSSESIRDSYRKIVKGFQSSVTLDEVDWLLEGIHRDSHLNSFFAV